MKIIALTALAGSAGAALVMSGVLPCPCELVSQHFGPSCCTAGECGPVTDAVADTPAGLYLEARNATVWGGACHIGSQAVSQGSHAALGWAFQSGQHAGVDLTGVRVAAAIEGSTNLQGQEVFRSGEAAVIRSIVWIDAPTAEARDAALDHVRAVARLGDVLEVNEAAVTVTRDGEEFSLTVPGVLSVVGEALPDRSCCTMPESRWYSPLSATKASIVGNPESCRFEGHEADAGSLSRWAFEGENSAFIATFGA